MLDELAKAADAIEAAGIFVKDWHEKLKPLPKVTAKAPCIRIWLNAEGHIVDLEPLAAPLAKKLRKFEPDNGKSFPGFNVRPMFFRNLANTKDAKEAEKTWVTDLKQPEVVWEHMLDGMSDLWAKDTINTVERVLKTISVNLRNMCGSLNEEETLSLLFKVVEKMSAQTFQDEYCVRLKEKIKSGLLPHSALVFFGKEDKEQKFSVYLDVKEYKDNQYPVAHEKTVARLNDLLLAESVKSGKSKEGRTPSSLKDAYGVDAAGSNNPKMAQVAVPTLGGVFLRSQAKEIPAQSRYDLCEGATFTVGDETRARVKRALEWLSNPEHNGQTYGIAGEKELLFAYPAKLPSDSCPELTLLLGAQSDDERKFEDLAKNVIGQLTGTGEVAAKDCGLEIFSLRKMDKARTKVVYYRNATVATLEATSRAWNEGFKNIPPLDIRAWNKEKNDREKNFTIPIEPLTLFPLRLHKILNTVWTLSRNEVKQSKVRLFEPTTGLRILLDTPEAAQVAYITERFLAHAQTYFLVLCRAKGRNEIAPLPDLDTYPGILGLLLYKLGKTKENYMNESAFLLGRFLRVADEIHRLYCEVVRKKEIPPELCGSSMLTAMLENPTQALSQLCVRSAPYLKWARAYHGEEKGGLVHYWMHQWAPIAENLHENNWPTRPSQEECAQIFLGYLSSFQKTENNPTSTENEGLQQ